LNGWETTTVTNDPMSFWKNTIDFTKEHNPNSVKIFLPKFSTFYAVNLICTRNYCGRAELVII